MDDDVTTGNSKDDVLKVALARFATSAAASSESRTVQIDDLKFAAGNSDNNWQWPSYAMTTRTAGTTGLAARPTLTINRLPQHIHQVTNDERQNRPMGRVIPADDKSDIEVAEILNGMVRHIQQASDADVAYDTACEQQVIHGEGFWRITTDYTDENSFDQDIMLEAIPNPFSVYMDPMIKRPCGEDQQYCFITEELTQKEYKALFPKAKAFNTMMEMGIGDESISGWINKDTVRIAEYFCYKDTVETLCLYPDGASAFKGSHECEQREMMGMVPVKTRQSTRRQVKWYKINGFEILDERDWPGKYIPIIRVIGNSFIVDGKTHISGLVRNAKDAQRMINYWTSQEAEMLALAPKAPFIGYGGQFEGYEKDWKTANTANHPYLQVNPDVVDGNGNAMPLPQRAQPPMVQSGLIAAKQGAYEDLKATTGQYNASLGQEGNERSGKAILARQREGDVGTYHYIDNLARAVRWTTRQLIDLIPKIYDTARIARTLGEDGKTSTMVQLDPEQPEPVKKVQDAQGVVIQKIYNPGVGKYDVVAVTGPGYSSKRQEAAESMVALLQTNPELMGLIGDEVVESMDWPGAQRIAKRIKKSIDPKLLADDEENPALKQAEQQMEQMQQHIQQMQGMLENVQSSMEAREIAIKEQEVQVKWMDAETRRFQAVAAAAPEALTTEQVQDIAAGTVDAALHAMMQQQQMGQQPEPQMPQEPMTTPEQMTPPPQEMM